KRIELPTLATSDDCTGSGSADGKQHTCTTCHGRGQVRMQRGIFTMQQTRPYCHGRGQVIANPCGTSRGAGPVEEEKALPVEIPAGFESGDRIALDGGREGGSPGAPPGDLYVDVRPRPNEIFVSDGADLHCQVPHRISQTAPGDAVVVPPLAREAEIRIHAE